MYSYLEDHALRNVWCAPDQDRQAIIAPKRITPQGGVWNQVKVGWRWHALPTSATRFHVYMLGKLHPLLLGLKDQQYKWISLIDAMNAMTMICDLYVERGIELPRFEAWYMVDADQNLVIAVKDPQPLINVDLNSEALYLRVYSNAFYQSLRATQSNTGNIVAQGVRPTNTNQILALQSQFQKYAAKPGKVYAFVNGYKVSGIDLFTCALGDAVEFIYDASIYAVVDFTLQELQTFTSILDSKAKYLLHYAGLGQQQIDYQDDIDVFLVHVTNTAHNRFKGLYVHRNGVDTLRMVTHKDYAIPVNILTNWANEQGWSDDYNQLVLRLHIRYGGWNRPLVDEAHRIKDLYKLQDSDLQRAMLGLDSTVSIWRADQLEDSAYTALMREPIPCLPEAEVEAAYGYNAISKLLADTPQFVESLGGVPGVNVPYGLQSSAYAYEYDSQGLLLSYWACNNSKVYPAHETRANLIELICGTGDTQLDEDYGSASTILDPTADYRMYTCPIVNGTPTNVWSDVTGSAQYGVVNNTLTWTIDRTKFYTLVRGNRRFLAYTLNQKVDRGTLNFTFTQRMRRNNAIAVWIMQIPMGELDLWLNGHSLIEGIDYHVNFPDVQIVTKEYFVGDPSTDTQKLDIRWTGFCKSDLSREDVSADFGYVVDGVLSADYQYDIRDDKVLRIVAGGSLYERTQLKFAETDAGVATLVPMNGKPYLVRDIVVPMRGQTLSDTYSMRAASLVIDQQISAYMSAKLPQPALPTPAPIEQLYRVYSPFCCRLLNDLNGGLLDDPRLYQQYSTQLVLELCKPYEYLLAFDPSSQANLPDPRFVIIHPHNLNTVVTIGLYQYKFLSMAVKQYLNNKVQLSGFLAIKNILAA